MHRAGLSPLCIITIWFSEGWKGVNKVQRLAHSLLRILFADGTALFSPEAPVLVKAVRVRVTTDQVNWLVLREIQLE